MPPGVQLKPRGGSLHRVGLYRATDMAGGVEAWQQAGLPLHRGPADVRR